MLDALNKSIEIYRIIVENAGEGIVIAQDDKILFVNPKMLEISGYTLEEALSKPFLEFLYPHDISETMDLYTRMIRGEKDLPKRHQLRIIHKKGYPVWIETTTVPINWQGRTATLNFIRDITEIKKAEEEKQKLQEKLIQFHKMETIGRFIAGIVHDLNNILTPIKGFTQLSIAKIGEHDPVNEYLKIIFSSVEKAEEFIKQLLTFYKKQPPKTEVLNVNELIEHIEDILKRLLGEDILLVKKLSPDLGAIEADSSQIIQVILNIAANAKDAMPFGGKFTIETSNVEINDDYLNKYNSLKKGNYIAISFTDSGVGIPQNFIDKIFEPLFTTKEYSTGLGLSTVYYIVKKHKGSITVNSEKDRGTTFIVYLPRVDKKIEKVFIEKKDKIYTGNETVLVIDDDENVRKLVIEILKKLGYKTLEAVTTDMALLMSQFYNKTIHLVISDIVLPGIGVSKLIRKIKNFRPNIKVLYMSALPVNTLKKYGIDENSYNFIQKPFSIELLSKKLREVLDK